ncbi:MAG TPA: cell division protein SepF [Acidimicrobiia bacterium]|jgi:cell division inhibitor SepF
MASLFNKALLYLGLVDEDQGGQADDLVEPGEAPPRPVRQPSSSRDRRQEEPVSRVEGRRVEPPPTSSRSSNYRTDTIEQSAPVRPIRPAEAQSDILLVEEFGDARMLADRVRDRVPVVLDLRQAQPDLVRRVIDFSSGLIYALDGTMSKVSEGVVLVLPPRVLLSQAEKRRLSRLGVYELVEED